MDPRQGKPQDARVDTSSPEFKSAVSAAAKEAFAELLAGAKAGSVPAGDASWVQELAMAIATLTDQNNGGQTKRISPEEHAKREAAKVRMFEMLNESIELASACNSIEEARAKGYVPEYRLINKIYLNERVIEPFRVDPDTKKVIPQDIYWAWAPNDHMRPLNKLAEQIFEQFLIMIGGLTAATRRTDNRPIWVTANGLTVKGAAPATRQVSNLVDSNNGSPFPDLGLKGGPSPANDPNKEHVHVLGTIAAPAKQNVVGAAR